MPSDNLPAPQPPLDRTAIERVLARATELQVASSSRDQSGMLTEAQLIEIGKEAGINPATITQALAEERSRVAVPEESGFVASITGPAVATASRTVTGTPEAILAVAAEAAPVAEAPLGEKQAPAKKESKKHVEEPEDDEHKDGVSLDELFSMKPEIFQAGATEEEESADKKKGKKTKKKSVELEFDEERGEVVARKKHKRGDDVFGEAE